MNHQKRGLPCLNYFFLREKKHRKRTFLMKHFLYPHIKERLQKSNGGLSRLGKPENIQ